MTIHEHVVKPPPEASLKNPQGIRSVVETKNNTIEHSDSSGDLHSSGEMRWLDSSSFSATLSRRNASATDEPPRLPLRKRDSSESAKPGKAFSNIPLPLPNCIDVPVKFVSVSPHHQRNVSQLSVPSLDPIEIDSLSSLLDTSVELRALVLDNDELTYSDVDDKSFLSDSLLDQLELESEKH